MVSIGAVMAVASAQICPSLPRILLPPSPTGSGLYHRAWCDGIHHGRWKGRARASGCGSRVRPHDQALEWVDDLEFAILPPRGLLGEDRRGLRCLVDTVQCQGSVERV